MRSLPVDPRARLGAVGPALVLALAMLLGGCASGSPTSAPRSSDQPSGSPSISPSPSPSTSPSTSTSASPVPIADPPAAGCYALDYAQALAPTNATDPLRCRRRHTAQTYAVGQLDTVDGGHLLAVDSARVQSEVATTCPAGLSDYLGGTQEDLRLSMLRAVWFTPTLAQADAGADWYRCDVIAVGSEDQLAPLAVTMRGALGRPRVRDGFAMCGTAEPGSSGFTRVVCSSTHSWRAIATVDLTPGKYPGLESVKAAGQTPCLDAGRDAAADQLDFQWSYEWPTRPQWRAGQTYGLCWAPD